ncbi:MAG: hypothetical protein WAS05_01205 [Candidatus Nanopelagicales bacterium]
MNKAQRIGTAVVAPALSASMLVGSVAVVASPAQAAPKGQVGSSKQVAVSAKGSRLSAKQTKAVTGVPQSVERTEKFTYYGSDGYVTDYKFNVDYLATAQVSTTAVKRVKTTNQMVRDLKSKPRSFHQTAYKYNKKTKAGYHLGWMVETGTFVDDNGKSQKVHLYTGVSTRGKGKTSVLGTVSQVKFSKEKANTKVLIKKADKAAKILAKRYKI